MIGTEVERERERETEAAPPPPVFETKRPRTAGRGANAGLGRGGGAGAAGPGGRGGAGKEIRGKDGGAEKKSGWGDSMRELTQVDSMSMPRGGELQQVVEMEKQRMKFAKELELQRMQEEVRACAGIENGTDAGIEAAGEASEGSGGLNKENWREKNATEGSRVFELVIGLFL